MKQNSYCTEVGVLPGTDFRVQPKYMDMLNLQEAWEFGRGAGQKVAVIDTGVTPHPRFQHLIAGGDYVMGGDGLSDCDAHGTIVASMIGAAPASGAAAPPAAPRKPVTIPTTEPPPKAPPPQTVTLVTVAADRDDGSAVAAGSTASGTSEHRHRRRRRRHRGRQHRRLPSHSAVRAASGAPGAANHGGGTVTIPSYSGGGQVITVDNPAQPAPAGPAAQTATAATAATPGTRASRPTRTAASRRTSTSSRSASPASAFGLKDPYTGDEDPQTSQKIDHIQTMARAIVHAANMGASVINISDVECMSARNIIDQRALGAAVRYAAVDKNAVIVAAAGDSSKKDCKQNPTFDPLQPNDPRNWNAVTTVVTPSWFSDYVLTVGAVDTNGQPLTQGGRAGFDEHRRAVGGDRRAGNRRHRALAP